MVVEAPITREIHRTLRRAVLDLREQEPRRRFPVTLHVGRPGHRVRRFAEPGDVVLDHSLRVDVAAAMLLWSRRAGLPALAWITRPGDLRTQDADLAWGAAVRSACGEADVPGDFVVVTRGGWQDPVSGVRREWRRLRRRGDRMGPAPPR